MRSLRTAVRTLRHNPRVQAVTINGRRYTREDLVDRVALMIGATVGTVWLFVDCYSLFG